MCKTWHLIYSCGHTFQIRLSKCRATVATQSRPGRPWRPACMGGAVLVFKKTCLCGDCASKKKQEELSEFRNKFDEGTPEREAAEREFDKQMFLLFSQYPALERQKRFKPLLAANKPTKELRGSLLREEVRREELVNVVVEEELSDEWTAYYEEWNSGCWSTASDGGDGDDDGPSWKDRDGDEAASLNAWDVVGDDHASDGATVDPWMSENNEPGQDSTFEGVSTLEGDSTPEPSCDDSSRADYSSATSEFEQMLTSTTSYDNSTNQCSKAKDVAQADLPLHDLTNILSLEGHQDIRSPEKANIKSSDSTKIPPSSQQDQRILRLENQKFKTMPPHLRRKITCVDRRASNTDSDDPEYDLIEQFKTFQFQTFITVSI